MSASPEPMTLAEMRARKRAADQRQAEAARRHIEAKMTAAERAARDRADRERREQAERVQREREAAKARALEALERRKELDALIHEIVPPEILKNEPKAIIKRAAEAYGLTYRDLVGRSRRHDIVRARHAAIAVLAADRPDLSLNALGRHFGGRDHTTILFALRKMHGPDYGHRPQARNGRAKP